MEREREIKRSQKITVAVLVCIVVAVIIGGHLRKTSPLFNFFFSPSDLYEPLATSDITVSESGTKISKEFSNKYPGNHTIGILVGKPTSVGENYDMGFSVKIEISENGVNKIRKVISEPYFPFWGVKSDSGIALLYYRVPEDLPLDKKLKATVTIERPDPEFENKYGNTVLYIKKMSDE